MFRQDLDSRINANYMQVRKASLKELKYKQDKALVEVNISI